MYYGYARVSSKDQNLERQIIELISFGVKKENIYYDKQSGKDFDRTNYKILKEKLEPGDVLVIKSIDRLGRNYEMIIEEWNYITKVVNCDIVVLDMDLLDTRSEDKNLVGKFISDIVLQILSFVAENERDNIKKRQAEGIKIAKQKGITFGRPKIKMPKNFMQIASQYKNKEITFEKALYLTKMSKTTFYKYYKKIGSSIDS